MTLPVGTRLSVGSAILEEAHKFVNAAEHRHLKFRGINARVVPAGSCRSFEEIRLL